MIDTIYQPFNANGIDSMFGQQSCSACGIELTAHNTHPVSSEIAYCVACAECEIAREWFALFFEDVARIAEQRVAEKKAAADAKKQSSLSILGRATFKATGAVLFGVEDRRGKMPAVMHLTMLSGKITGCIDAATGETCSGRKWSGHCCHEDRVMQYEATRTDDQSAISQDDMIEQEQLHESTIVAAALLPEMASHDDVAAHVEDSIASGELDWIDEERAAWAKMTLDERRASYSDTFDLSYGDAA